MLTISISTLVRGCRRTGEADPGKISRRLPSGEEQSEDALRLNPVRLTAQAAPPSRLTPYLHDCARVGTGQAELLSHQRPGRWHRAVRYALPTAPSRVTTAGGSDTHPLCGWAPLLAVNTQVTVNNQMVFGTLMNLCDNPTRVSVGQDWRSADTVQRVPIIVTGNDFSTLWAPLIRDGRMDKFYW